MKKHDKGFEDFFRESFEGAEMTPSKHVWDNISNRLDGKTQTRPAYWWSGGIAAALLLMFCAYVVVYNPFANSTAITNNTVKNIEAKQVSTPENITKNNVTTDKNITNLENNQNSDKQNTNNGKITKQSNDKIISGSGNDVENKDVRNSNTNNSIVSKTIVTNITTNNSKATKQRSKNKLNKSNSITKATKNTEVKSINSNKINNDKIATQNTQISEEFITIDKQSVLLTSLGFAIIPSEIKPLNVIMMPMVITKTSITKPIMKSKAGFEVMLVGSYNSFNPNFSNVKDGIYPNPFVRHENPQSRNVYDSTLIADGLAKPLVISSYSVGVVFNKNIYKGLGLRTGISYTSISYDIKHNLAVYDVFIASGGPNTLHQQTQLVNIPISVFYQQQTGKFIYGLQAGIQADILVNNKLDNDLYARGSHVYSFGTYNNLNINGLAGLRLGYMLNSHFSLNVEANYRQALGSVYDTPYLQSNPHSLGMGLGLGYRF
jgi:hypothetical protein